MNCGTVIRYEYSPESLGGISRTAFEAELYDAFRDRWPGCTINIVEGINDKCWGVINDETEIDEAEIRRIGEAVFSDLCRGERT
jgi:hypothetical protein